jgi:peptidyl-dipeptidase Dcp
MAASSTNPLLQKSTLPHGAFAFDLIKKEHFRPAMAAAIAEAKANLEKIRKCADAPTFENTILALETASETVGQVSTVFFNLLGTNSDDEMQAMAREISPQLADFSSDVLLDPELFARVKTVWENREKFALKGEELRLTEKSYKEFARNGGLLSNETKEKLRQLDQEMARLSPEFSDNVLKATNEFRMVLDKKSDLEGLPESSIEAAALAAREAGVAKEGEEKWLFNLQIPSLNPFMTYSARPELREKLWRAFGSRAFKGAHSNELLAKKIAQLRHDRANLLGYPSHAHFVLEERMAERPEKVTEFLSTLLEKSKPAAERDVAAVAALKKEMTGDGTLMPWDYGYYSEKLKMKLHDLDDEVLRPYFKLENVIQGVFEHARRLYGLKFQEVHNIPLYHPDVKTYEVVEENGGRFIGLFYADFFPRESKRGGAWMSTFREQGLQGGKIERPHVTIVCNFTPPTDSKPALLTLDEVSTLFHEFGHALHALLSECKYISLAGTNVYWDFVELPSQIMENWCYEKEALDLFASHYLTGEKIPKDLTDKIRASAKFQAGYSALRQLTFGLLDMAWHSLGEKGTAMITDVDAFEKQVTERTRLLPSVLGTNMSCSFNHIFSGGYSAGYYSYKWAEVLDADAFEYFREQGLFSPEVAKRFRDHILKRGGTEHPMELYKKFRGREPDPNALLRRDGLIEQSGGK